MEFGLQLGVCRARTFLRLLGTGSIATDMYKGTLAKLNAKKAGLKRYRQR